MKQVIIKNGKGEVTEVPRPEWSEDKFLIKNIFSCISSGTEMSSIQNTSKPLWKRGLENPKDVKKVINAVINQGLNKTAQVIKGRISSGNQVGYSSSGIVLKVPVGESNIKIGDHVACSGTGYALHADIISVPKNLVVIIPKSQSLANASTVALGAIAMQGVRRSKPTLGEVFVVIGLGVIGQITVQLLLNNGCTVIGIDIDKNRGKTAIDSGMNFFINPLEENSCDQVKRITNAYGSDGVIITAGSSSNQIISDAFQMSRRKGRVVLVGSVGLNLQRSDFYQNEVDFLISTSYGPGRYDSTYEEGGIDYPLAYVRWTENRNMKLYLDLLNNNKIILKSIISEIIDIDKAHTAYELLNDQRINPLIVLIKYSPDIENVLENNYEGFINSNISNKTIKKKSLIGLSLIGAGGFAKGVHLPNLKKLKNKFVLQHIVANSGHNARSTAEQYGFISYGTNTEGAYINDDVDAVLIATRHNTHAKFTLDCLKAGKHVLVEKPLVLNQQELNDITDFYKSNNEYLPIVLTGFNRRFSNYLSIIKKEISERINPMIINYRMNAGYQPLDLWYHGVEGGGRNIGEACHIYDLFTFLVNDKVCSVEAFSITPKTDYYSSRDNFTAIMKFEDGSIASLTYSALGNNKSSKESMDIYVDGKVIILDDYKSLKMIDQKTKKTQTRFAEKGHFMELDAFADAIINKKQWPIPLWQQIQAMQIAIDVEKCLDK